MLPAVASEAKSIAQIYAWSVLVESGQSEFCHVKNVGADAMSVKCGIELI
jgi:hypothetical protein